MLYQSFLKHYQISLDIKTISSEFGPAVVICQMYIEAKCALKMEGQSPFSKYLLVCQQAIRMFFGTESLEPTVVMIPRQKLVKSSLLGHPPTSFRINKQAQKVLSQVQEVTGPNGVVSLSDVFRNHPEISFRYLSNPLKTMHSTITKILSLYDYFLMLSCKPKMRPKAGHEGPVHPQWLPSLPLPAYLTIQKSSSIRKLLPCNPYSFP